MSNSLNVFRKSTLTLKLLPFVAFTTSAALADSSAIVNIDIAGQQAGMSLLELSKKTGSQIVLEQGLGSGLKLPPIKGSYTLTAALDELLSGTNLQYEFISDDAVVITKKPDNKKFEKSNRESIEEMVVTAQKRQQSVQDVPIAISALSADLMERRGIESPEDLQFSTPNLNLGQQAANGYSNVVATIRGVGTVNALLDPGVPMHIDGHYIQATAFLGRDLLDVERVEILRGPQGTLYGRNAIGGSINVITKRPTDELGGMFSVDLGNYDKRLVQGVLNVPISDRLRARIAIGDEKRDGYTKNISGVGNPEIDNSNYTYVRASAEYDITDNMQAFVSAYSYKANFQDISFRRINNYPEAGEGQEGWVQLLQGVTNPSVSDPYSVSLNDPVVMDDDAKGVSFDISWALENMEIRSLSSYNDSNVLRLGDFDSTSVISGSLQGFIQIETFSQELQAISTGNGRLNWQGGLYYYRQDSAAPAGGILHDMDVLAPSFGISAFQYVEDYPSIVTSYGVYGQVEYSLTDNLELIAGGRFTVDEKDQIGFNGNNLNDTGEVVVNGIASVGKWNQFTYRTGLNYHVSDESMIYVAYSTGYRAGGVFVISTYEPEYINVVEAGLKSQWLDRRLQVNVASFYSEYDDKQEIVRILQPDGNLTLSGRVANVPNTKIYGVEAEITALLTDLFSIDGSITWQDSQYNGLTIADPLSESGLQDITGNRLANSATWRYYLGTQYILPLNGDNGEITARADISYVGDQDGTIWNHPESAIPSYYRVNARLRWDSADRDWRAELYIQNLLDEASIVGKSYSNSFFFGNAEMVTYLPPRTFGFKLTHDF